MRIVILTIALLASTVPAFADCMTHEAAKPDTVVTTTTTTTETPAPTPASGG